MGQSRFSFFIITLFISHNLWAGFSGTNAIYNTDERELVSKKSPQKIQEIARSVAYIVSNDLVSKGIFKTMIKALTLKSAINLCEDERFSSLNFNPACTGFLVAPDIMISAGHCFVDESDCAGKKIIFDVDDKKQTIGGYSVANNTVYSCKRIISRAADGLEDYSIIELDKATSGRRPLVLNLKDKVSDDTQVFMIGHPLGLPQTYSKPANIVENTSPMQFKAELDSFTGNSGSPVINSETFEVEGILVNGQEDLVFDSQKQCYRNMIYNESGGEGVFRSINLPAFK